MTEQESLPTDGKSFVTCLMPTAIVAMSGTEVVTYLQLEGPKKLKSKERNAVVDSTIARGNASSLSVQSQDKLRRAMQQITNDINAEHPAWGSMSMVRGMVTLSLWQTALESTVILGGKLLCGKEKGRFCECENRGFKNKWTHFIGSLSRLNSDFADSVVALYQVAVPDIKLRHRLIHGNATGEDGVRVERVSPQELHKPLSGLRESMIQAVLAIVFNDEAPAETMYRAYFEVLGLPQDVLDDALKAVPGGVKP